MCVCPFGVQLMADGKTCSEQQELTDVFNKYDQLVIDAVKLVQNLILCEWKLLPEVEEVELTPETELRNVAAKTIVLDNISKISKDKSGIVLGY